MSGAASQPRLRMVELKYFDGKCSTAGHEVFTISCPEAVGKHCVTSSNVLSGR